jgi:hypothetical protein
MHLRTAARLTIVVAVIASTAVASCGGSVADDAARAGVRAATKSAEAAPIPGRFNSDLPPVGGIGDDLPPIARIGDDATPLGSATDDVARAKAESNEARAVLETMIEGDERTWVCLGLDVVAASSDGDLTIQDYASVLTAHGFGYVPAYQVLQAFTASTQLLQGDLSQLQQIACV